MIPLIIGLQTEAGCESSGINRKYCGVYRSSNGRNEPRAAAT